jgi:hypothetical protein
LPFEGSGFFGFTKVSRRLGRAQILNWHFEYTLPSLYELINDDLILEPFLIHGFHWAIGIIFSNSYDHEII